MSRFGVLGLCFVAASGSVWAGSYSGGDGTETRPYQIGRATDWMELIGTPGDWDEHFELTADIDFEGAEIAPVGTWQYAGTAFSGVLDGAGYVVSDFVINQPEDAYVGLFGSIGRGGEVHDFGVESFEVIGGERVGGLCGSNYGLIEMCYAMGQVVGSKWVGGLCGDCAGGQYPNGVIRGSYASGSVEGYEIVGGLCGANALGTILACYATCSTTGVEYVGGLVGDNGHNLIEGSYATGDVVGERYVGGLCGFNDGGTINECRATGNVEGTTFVGGLCGYSDAMISGGFASGTVDGLEEVGGLAGYNGGEIRSSEARGSVSGGEDVGGLCGTNYGLLSDCHAVGDVLAFDWIGGARSVGGLCGANWWGEIDRCSASGSVVGGDTAGGLCGDNAEGRISRSYATGAVTGGYNVGGLCGYNEGLISDCYATGAVSGRQEVGGLCGLSCGFGEPSIARSFAAGRVSGVGDDPLRLGGLLGGFGSEGETGGCFWDVDASGMDVSEGGVGKTTGQMKTQALFGGAGWDLVGEDLNGGADVWRMCLDGGAYPRLSWEYARGGDFDCPDGVGLEDLQYLAERWLAGDAEAVGAADGNGDGRADMGDFARMAGRWRVRPLHDMVLIPAGTFQMGDDRSEGWPGETPVHTVTLSSFSMSRYETTNAQYCRFLNWAMQQGLITIHDGTVFKTDSGFDFRYCNTDVRDSGSQIVYTGGVFSVRTGGGRDMGNDPMVKVSWYGAAAYCNWLSEQEGLKPCYDLSAGECDFTKNGYRLPTEAQWEYAARGGLCGKRFPWGDTISHGQANYYSDHDSWYDYDISPTRGYHPDWYDGSSPYTSPVGSFAANGYGLYDMAGNVEEWCNDWRGNYEDSWQTDPIGPATGEFRAVRGGGWGSEGRACRVTSRHVYSYPEGTDLTVGFRVCR